MMNLFQRLLFERLLYDLERLLYGRVVLNALLPLSQFWDHHTLSNHVVVFINDGPVTILNTSKLSEEIIRAPSLHDDLQQSSPFTKISI